MTRTSRFCAVLTAVLAAGAGRLHAQGTPEPDAGKVLLQLRLKEGKVYNVYITSRQTVSQEIAGRKEDTTKEIGVGYRMAVVKVADSGNMTVKITCDSAKIKRQDPFATVDYDSTRPGPSVPSAAKPFAAMLGQGFELEMTPQGDTVKVEGADKLIEAVMKAVELPAGADRSALDKTMREDYGDKAMKENMVQMVAAFPAKPVGIGDSWRKTASITKPFPMKVEHTYTLKSCKDGVAVIEIRSKLQTSPDGPPMKRGPISVRPDLSGEASGTQEIHEATGWIKWGKVSQEFSGKLKMEGAPGMPQAMEIPISVKGTMTIESR